jgi:hypothetical protein
LTPPEARVRFAATTRLVRSRHPPENVFARISPAADHDALTDLESWTNERIQNDTGERVLLPESEGVTGPMATIVMAAFCHPRPTGGRFTSGMVGGWYAAAALRTAHAEVAHHWWRELDEVGATAGRVEARQYLADFDSTLHDVRNRRRHAALYAPHSYAAGQRLGSRLRREGANGIVYDSVRDPGHACVVAFRPKLVRRVRQGAHFEYVWSGHPTPRIRRLTR